MNQNFPEPEYILSSTEPVDFPDEVGVAAEKEIILQSTEFIVAQHVPNPNFREPSELT